MTYNSKVLTQQVTLLLACFGLPLVAQASDTGGVLPNGNTADGSGGLFSRTTGIANSGFGFQSLFHDTTGSYNTATGYRALFYDTSGYSNTADGYEALYSDTTGIRNTAVGAGTLLHNNGSANTAIGWGTLFSNTTGVSNTGSGYQALFYNTAGFDNTAMGWHALFSNTVGVRNTAVGVDALPFNIGGPFDVGNSNTAVGWQALYGNQSGSHNTAVGERALATATDGGGNTAIGNAALGLLGAGNSNVALGYLAGYNLTTGNSNVYIGSVGADESNTIRIGQSQTKTFIAGIEGTTLAQGAEVFVNADGQLGSIISSARFKDDIKPMDKASEVILALRPVTFRYKEKLDPTHTPQFGLVAEEVDKIDPDLVVRDKDGGVYTVRYGAVNAMLLNEFLKEHHQVQDLKAIVFEQQKQIKALTNGLQKVNDKLELSKPAPQTVDNHQ